MLLTGTRSLAVLNGPLRVQRTTAPVADFTQMRWPEPDLTSPMIGLVRALA